ncbi:MAG: response regulator, partial [Nitrosomonas sp.]
ISATHGEFGLELARRYKPQVILLDIHLPGMDGYKVLEALKTDPITRDIPVIALSADAMPIDIDRGLQAGFIQYLTKPVKMDVLHETIARYL